MHAVLVLHAGGQVPGAAEPADVGGGDEGVEEEAGAAREGAGVRAVLQRRGRQRRGGAVREVHAALGAVRMSRARLYTVVDHVLSRST